MQLYRTANGNVALKLAISKRPALLMRLDRRLNAYFNRFERITNRAKYRILYRFAYPLMRKIPIKRHNIFFESQWGQVAAGSPRAIYDYMKHDKRFHGYTFIWSVDSDNAHNLSGENLKFVQRESWGYMFALATSAIVIDDQTFAGSFNTRRDQFYLQTWHGIPFKKMGLDVNRIKRSMKKQNRLLNKVKQWDALIAPNKFFIDTFVRAFDYKGPLITGGTPRNDTLVGYSNQEYEAICAKLDIPKDRAIVLYTPTFREANRVENHQYTLPINLLNWVESLGEKTIFLYGHIT